MAESFRDFRRSFSYGSRTDLSFKFLSEMSDGDAGEFFRLLLRLLGEAFDTGDAGPLLKLARETQEAAYGSGAPGRWVYEEGPFTPFRKPLAHSRVLLFTSSGHFVAGRDPAPLGKEGMTQEEAVRRIGEFFAVPPVLSAIPREVFPGELRVRHPGYDIRSTEKDPDVTFPLARLLEAEEEGRIGEVASHAYSFPGAVDQGRLHDLLPEWVEKVRNSEVDAVVMVPV